jgi:hypothetical protein
MVSEQKKIPGGGEGGKEGPPTIHGRTYIHCYISKYYTIYKQVSVLRALTQTTSTY